MKNFVFLIALLLFACQPKSNEKGTMVTVSILSQKYFVDQISGGHLQVNVLVPPGASPHEYEVLPSQMKALSKSVMWLQLGLLGFEQAWTKQFADLNKDVRLVNTSMGIELLTDNDGEDDSHAHSGAKSADPHVWLAPAECKILAKNTFNALKSAFPKDSLVFRTNYNRFISEIDSLSSRIDVQLSGMTNRSFLIFHPTLGYFARQYHLEQIPLELNGKEPSPKHMKALVDLAREKNIHTIFIQKEFDVENAKQLAHEIDGKVVVIDPLAYDWKKQIDDFAAKLATQK